MPVPNKPLAIMATDVKAHAFVLRKNDSYSLSALHWMPPQSQSPKRWAQADNDSFFVHTE